MVDETVSLVDYAKYWNRTGKGDVLALDPGDSLLDTSFITTGIPTVDEAFGGGIPRGRISMFFGEDSSGKTLLAQLVMAAVHKENGTVIYVDGERTFSREWFATTGVSLDPNRLMILHPRNLEEGFDMIDNALRTVKPDLIVLDSIPSLLPKSHFESEMADKDFRGDTPRKITEGLGRIVPANSGKTAVILINQMRVNPNVMYGSPETLPGGKALRHNTALRVRVRRGGWITDASKDTGGIVGGDSEEGESNSKAKKIGYVLKILVEKNKVSTPFREAEIRFFFTGEMDKLSMLVGQLLEKELITVTSRGGYYRSPLFEGTIQGRDNLNQRIKDDDDLRSQFELALQGLV